MQHDACQFLYSLMSKTTNSYIFPLSMPQQILVEATQINKQIFFSQIQEVTSTVSRICKPAEHKSNGKKQINQ